MRYFKFLVEEQGYIPREFTPYDTFVDFRIREHLGAGLNWRGYETFITDDDGETKRLKIVGGLLIGGLLHVTYEIVEYTGSVGNLTERRTTYQLAIALNQQENYFYHLR